MWTSLVFSSANQSQHTLPSKKINTLRNTENSSHNSQLSGYNVLWDSSNGPHNRTDPNGSQQSAFACQLEDNNLLQQLLCLESGLWGGGGGIQCCISPNLFFFGGGGGYSAAFSKSYSFKVIPWSLKVLCRQLRARRVLLVSRYVPLRTRRALSLYTVYGDGALLVLSGTSLNSGSTLLALSWWCGLCYCGIENMIPWETNCL